MSEDYVRARKMALRQVRRDTNAGRYPYPPALDDILKGQGCEGEVPLGEVELDPALIAGTRTRGRQNCFSSTFMPLPEQGSEFATKWDALCESVAEEGIREPVVVYEYLQRFYVQEGNKRVSVARFLDVPSITAEVTRVVPMPSDERETRIYRAFMDFYDVCPVYGIQVSDEDAYAKLAHLAGHDLVTPWPQEDVRALRSLLFKFQMSFRAHGGEGLDLDVGDALLAFVTAVGYERACKLTLRAIGARVENMWGEFEVTAADEVNAYLEEPPADAGVLGSLAYIARGGASARPYRAAFIYDEDAQTSGWDALHEQGRLSLQRRLGGTVETFAYPECSTPAAFDDAVKDALAKNCELVVTVQPTQMGDCLRAAVEHPKTTFLNCSVSLSHTAVRTFACRMYEAKFLMGALAASMAQNHLVGYVAESPVYSTVSEINAFALGAAIIDPHAKVLLSWLSTKDYDWREQLVARGAKIVSGRDNLDPRDPERPWGLFEARADGSTPQLARPVWNWGRYYELIVRSLRAGTAQREQREYKNQALNYWWGLSSGVLDVDLADDLPRGQKELVGVLRQSVLTHRLDPFAGRLVSQAGLLHEGPGRLTPEEIVRMNWLNENVIGSIPGMDQLLPTAQEHVAVAGILTP